MITGQEYIDNLNKELNQSTEFTKYDVFNEFEKYVDKNKVFNDILSFICISYLCEALSKFFLIITLLSIILPLSNRRYL